MRPQLVIAALVGCYEPPDLPIQETLDIVPSNACALDRSARVSCVLDGDTVDLDACGEEVGERVRMLGVDAPEIEHPPDPTPADCWGDEAHAELERLTSGQRVEVTFDEDCVDIFGRTLAYLWLVGPSYERIADETDVDEYTRTIPGDTEPALMLNEWLISRGMAEVFAEERFGRLQWQLELESAESDARLHSRGLWGACDEASARMAAPPDGGVNRERERG